MSAAIIGSQGAEFKKRLISATECRMGRRLQEREVFQFKTQATQLQHHIREITAPDFRLRKLVSLLKILRRIETNTYTGLYAPRTPGALPSTRLRNFLDGQPLDSRLRIVSRNARHARINDIGNPRNRKGCLGNVCRKHDACLSCMLKDAALFIGTHAAVKRQDVETRRIQFVGKLPSQILNVALGR